MTMVFTDLCSRALYLLTQSPFWLVYELSLFCIEHKAV